MDKKSDLVRFIRPAVLFLVLFCLFLTGSRSVSANVVFEQNPLNESFDTYNGAILNSQKFLSFGCTLNLNCGVSGQTIYNVGVWIKKVGNPNDVRLRVTDDWTNPTGGTSVFSNPVSASSISDTEYTLKWFYFPQGIVIGNLVEANQFFQFQFTDTLGTYNPTDHYRILLHDTSDFTGPQQWCRNDYGCASAKIFFKLDDSTTDLSLGTSVLPTCCSNVLFIPGLEASRLYESNCPLNCEDRIWEPNIFGEVDELYLDINGDSINQGIYTKDIIDNTLTFNVYKSLISQLNNSVYTDKINLWKSYAYDWRMGVDSLIQNGTRYYDNQTITLTDILQSLINSSKNGKVTILAHSNGGLLAKELIKKLEDMKSLGQNDLVDHIDSLILVASPQLGTPDAFSGLLHGYKQSIPYKLMSETQARKLAQNMSSAYGLLPSRRYFDQVGISHPGVFSSTSPQTYRTNYGSDIDSYDEEHNFILGQEGRIQPGESDLGSPILGNSVLLSQAETLHDSIDNMIFPVGMKVINIAGWGKETVAGIRYINADIEPVFTFNGDKTVVSQSALYGQGTKYWLDLSGLKLQHRDILEDPQLLAFIGNLIEQKPPVFSVITDTEPFQVGNRLHLSVHSPVSIGVYDSQGNFTGKVCDNSGNCLIQENIPGSTYIEFGEGKYTNLAQSDLQKAVLQGTDVGTFTFDYQTVDPNGQTVTSSFVDIPVTTQTQGVVTNNLVNQAPQLTLDVTGDGVTDFTLSPNSAFDPITYLQIMKATIDSLDLTQAKKTAFDNRVDNIIKLIQKGKIDRVKLKADKFKDALQDKLSKPDPKKPKPKKLSKTDAQLLLDLLNGLLDNLG